MKSKQELDPQTIATVQKKIISLSENELASTFDRALATKQAGTLQKLFARGYVMTLEQCTPFYKERDEEITKDDLAKLELVLQCGANPSTFSSPPYANSMDIFKYAIHTEQVAIFRTLMQHNTHQLSQETLNNLLEYSVIRLMDRHKMALSTLNHMQLNKTKSYNDIFDEFTDFIEKYLCSAKDRDIFSELMKNEYAERKPIANPFHECIYLLGKHGADFNLIFVMEQIEEASKNSDDSSSGSENSDDEDPNFDINGKKLLQIATAIEDRTLLKILLSHSKEPSPDLINSSEGPSSSDSDDPSSDPEDSSPDSNNGTANAYAFFSTPSSSPDYTDDESSEEENSNSV